MGEYAEYELQRAMRRGTPHRPGVPRVPKPLPKDRQCPDCGKMVRGDGGLMQHQKTVHGYKHKSSDINRAIEAARRAMLAAREADHG